jgi:hypothetical protein
MPAAIDQIIKQRVIAQYLQGVSRDKIAADNGIGTGTVSNIIDEWKKGVQDSDYESIRELSVFCKKQGMTLNALASCIRLNNYIEIALNPVSRCYCMHVIVVIFTPRCAIPFVVVLLAVHKYSITSLKPLYLFLYISCTTLINLSSQFRISR